MYHFSQILETPFEQAIAQVTEALKQEGFGVLTEIDVKATFKRKLDADFHPYLILGACHPQIAYRMLNADDKAGVFYPCNVVVQEHPDGRVEVSAIDPAVMFQAVDSPAAKEITDDARQLMQAVMDRLGAATSVA